MRKHLEGVDLEFRRFAQENPKLVRKDRRETLLVLAARLEGKDPAAERRQLRRKITTDSVNDVVAEYYARHVDKTRLGKETRRVLDREILSG
jgi:hypothetical protein